MRMQEEVLCLKRETLQMAGVFQGLSLEVDNYLPLLANPKNLFFLPRSEADQNFHFKQWIPYVLIFQAGKILRYRRGNKGGESRLRGFYSIGIGGHITRQDWEKDAGYEAGMIREVREETGLQTAPTSAVAVINDDSTQVGKVHFGVVHMMRLPENIKASAQREISRLEFIDVFQASPNLDAYESWSQLCLNNLLPQWLAQTEPKNCP